MPFVWTQVVKMGQIHGNRTLGSKVNLTNGMWFSYPGYNEILCGRADDQRIDSNAKTLNLIKPFWSNLQMSMAKPM